MSISRDNNNILAGAGLLNSDGKTIKMLFVDPTGHYLNVSDDVTGSDHGPTNDIRDSNNIPILMGVSSSDGKTPVAIYLDASNNLLVKSS